MGRRKADGPPAEAEAPQAEVPQSDTNGNLAADAQTVDKPKPVHKIIYPIAGGSLSCSIWEKTVDTQNGSKIFYSISLQRSYHDGSWKFTSFLREQDLPTAVVAFQDAYQWTLRIRQPAPQTCPF